MARTGCLTVVTLLLAGGCREQLFLVVDEAAVEVRDSHGALLCPGEVAPMHAVASLRGGEFRSADARVAPGGWFLWNQPLVEATVDDYRAGFAVSIWAACKGRPPRLAGRLDVHPASSDLVDGGLSFVPLGPFDDVRELHLHFQASSP